MPLDTPCPLPSYQFDPALSEDENFLTWVTIFARYSVSRKGHMAALIATAPKAGYDPRKTCQPSASTSNGSDDPPQRFDASSRVIVHANNHPVHYGRSPKTIPEVHAETHCIALAARQGRSIEGATLYVTFPPCSECSRVILASGITRCVFRKATTRRANESALVSAEMSGVSFEGTSACYDFLQDQAEAGPSSETLDDGAEEEEEAEASTSSRKTAANGSSPAIPTPEELASHLLAAGRLDEGREANAQTFWHAIGETTQVTRDRVDVFWKQWLARGSAAARKVKAQWSVWDAIEMQMEEKYGKKWMTQVSQIGRRRAPQVKAKENGKVEEKAAVVADEGQEQPASLATKRKSDELDEQVQEANEPDAPEEAEDAKRLKVDPEEAALALS